MIVNQDYYKNNIDFWETAWSRVKNLHKKPTETDYLETLPKQLKDYGLETVLDLACGSGWLAVYLNSFGFKTVGTDISPAAIKLAHRWVEEENLKDIEFYVQDMVEPDFPENKFDAVVISSCLEHLDKDRADIFFKNLKKIVKSEGYIFGCFDEVCVGTKGEYETLEDGMRIYKDDLRKGMILRNYSDEEIKALLKENNWELISMETSESGARLVWAKNLK